MEEPIARLTIYNFIKRFLLHAITVWVIVNIWSWFEYIYKVKFDLAYSVNKDGSPVSFLDNFINHNINQPLCLWMLILAFLAEVNFLLVFQRKNLAWVVFSSICLGLAGGAASLIFTKHYVFYPILAQFIESALFIPVSVNLRADLMQKVKQ